MDEAIMYFNTIKTRCVTQRQRLDLQFFDMHPMLAEHVK